MDMVEPFCGATPKERLKKALEMTKQKYPDVHKCLVGAEPSKLVQGERRLSEFKELWTYILAKRNGDDVDMPDMPEELEKESSSSESEHEGMGPREKRARGETFSYFDLRLTNFSISGCPN